MIKPNHTILVTIFKDLSDISNPHQISISSALNRIRTGKSKELVEQIRKKAAEGKNYDYDKKKLPFIEFSAAKTKGIDRGNGKITHRLDESIVEHSGLFVLDFDKCSNIEQKIEQLKKDPYIFAVWIAPSGTGIKGLVKCPPNIEAHNLYYTAFLERYSDLDPTSRSLSRGTYESYDPNIYVNENSLVWDKKLTEEQRRQNKERKQNRRGIQVLSVAVAMIRSSLDGEKHNTLRNAAVLVGGYIAAGRVNENEARKLLEEEIRLKNPKDLEGARKTIQDGIEYGKQRPLAESKKIEKAQQYLRREDGTFDFLADEEEMMEYEKSVVEGTLEMGLPTGFNELNAHWLFKKHHIVWWSGADNVGKSSITWYFGVLVARLHGWKILIQSAENTDGHLRRKLKEFYLGKSLKVADDEELTKAHEFVKKHFRIVSSKQFHTLEDFLIKCELVYDYGFEYDLVIADPWNSFDPPKGTDRYSYTIHGLNLLRVFKENYSAIWVADHINTTAARTRTKDGFQAAPHKSDVEFGVMKANKTDDFIVVHRVINHPQRKNELEIHVGKIKDVDSGGFPTPKDEPVILTMNFDRCGYSAYGVDPIKLLNAKSNLS